MADNNENKKDGGFNFPPVEGGKEIKTQKSTSKFNKYLRFIRIIFNIIFSYIYYEIINGLCYNK